MTSTVHSLTLFLPLWFVGILSLFLNGLYFVDQFLRISNFIDGDVFRYTLASECSVYFNMTFILMCSRCNMSPRRHPAGIYLQVGRT